MNKRTPLSRTPHGCLAVTTGVDGLAYAVANEEAGTLTVTREATVPSVAELQTQVTPGELRVATAIGGDDVVCEIVELPTTQPAEIKQMLELQLDHLTPLPAEEVVYDFTPLETVGDKTRVLIALGRKSAINERVAPLETAGLPPELVTVDVLALFRALTNRGVLPGDDKLNGLVRVEATRCDLVLFTRGQPVAIRALAGTTGLAAELQRTVFAAQVTAPTLELGKLTVLGPVEDLTGAWGEPVEVLANGAAPTLPASVCAEAGAATRLNLLPDEWRVRRRAARNRQRWVRFGIAAGVVYLLMLAGLLAAVGWRKAQITRLAAQKQNLEQPYRAARDLRSELFAMQAQLDDKYSALEILRSVSTVLPENTKLNAFTYRRGDAVTLKGQADAAQAVYSLVERLQQTGLFAEVKMGGGGVRSEPGSGLTRFEIGASLPAAPGSKPGGGAWR